MSIAFHPEIDSQTERINQTLEVYLRHYVNYQQSNQVSLLPVAQLSYNCKVLDTTQLSPFFASYRKDANLHLNLRVRPKAKKALVNALEIQAIHKEIAKQIEARNNRTATYSRKIRKNRPQLKKEDKVYLITKNIKSKRLSKKLDYVKVGPFLIKQQKGLVNYKLDLPRDTNIYLVFYVSLLELVDSRTPLQETFYFGDEEKYKVERILEQKGQEYLIKQKGYRDTENTWELYKYLKDYQQLL